MSKTEWESLSSAQKRKHWKGIEEERWDMEEAASMKGLPWQPDPNALSMEVKSRVILPTVPPTSEEVVDERPVIARGVATRREESIAMVIQDGSLQACAPRRLGGPKSQWKLYTETLCCPWSLESPFRPSASIYSIAYTWAFSKIGV